MARYLYAVALLVLLGGCASTESVRQLADKTAANVGTISVHLARLDANSRDMADRRAVNISRLHAANAELKARYVFDVALTKKTGGGPNLALLDDIEEWGKEVDGILETAKVDESAYKKTILDGQKKLDTKSKALAEIGQSLASLAEKESRKDRLRFLAGYAKDLRQELKTALEQDTRTARNAKALLTKVRGSLDSGIPE